jgi:hypothetical protein
MIASNGFAVRRSSKQLRIPWYIQWFWNSCAQPLKPGIRLFA